MTQIATYDESVGAGRRVFGRQPAAKDEIDAYISDKSLTHDDIIAKLSNSQWLTQIIIDAHRNELYKFVSAPYLATSFDHDVKRDCYFFHYVQLLYIIADDKLDNFLSTEITTFECAHAEKTYRIALSRSPSLRNEGELSLFFKIDNTVLYTITFTIVPGYAVGLKERRTILLSRMQGARGMLQQIRESTKALKEVSPQAALLAAFNGIAKALGLEHIAGVCSTNQLSYCEGRKDLFNQAYDQFFFSVGARGPSNGFFYLDVPIPQKPLSMVKRGHRLRTKAKQKLKALISEDAFRSFANVIDKNFLERKERTRIVREKYHEMMEYTRSLEAELARLNAERDDLRTGRARPSKDNNT